MSITERLLDAWRAWWRRWRPEPAQYVSDRWLRAHVYTNGKRDS
jgi:hypothetical protein